MKKIKNYVFVVTWLLALFSCQEQEEITPDKSPEVQPDFIMADQLDDKSFFLNIVLERLEQEGHNLSDIQYYVGAEGNPITKANERSRGGVTRAFKLGTKLLTKINNNGRTRCNNGIYEETKTDGNGNVHWRIKGLQCPEYNGGVPSFFIIFYYPEPEHIDDDEDNGGTGGSTGGGGGGSTGGGGSGGGTGGGTGGGNTGGGSDDGIPDDEGEPVTVIEFDSETEMQAYVLESQVGFLDPQVGDFLRNNPDFTDYLFEFFYSQVYNSETLELIREIVEAITNGTEQEKDAAYLMLKMYMDKFFNREFTDDYFNKIKEHVTTDLPNEDFEEQWQSEVESRAIALRALHPEWSEAKIYWEVSKQLVHFTLDIIGLIPVVGEAADLINGGLYLIDGDVTQAGLSFGAAVPFAGWAATGTKLLVKKIETAGGKKLLKVIAKGTDEIAALATKLKNKFDLIVQNGITILKNKLGKIISRGDDVGRVLSNVADAINDRQRNVISQWADNIVNATNKQKGNFGEIGADLDLAEKGYIPLQRRLDDINAPGHNGIDGVYVKDGQYFIVEGKYSGSASLNPANPDTGLARQMSDDWIRTRDWSGINLDQSVIDNLLATQNYQRVLAKVAPDGSVTYKLVDANGYIITGNTGIFNP